MPLQTDEFARKDLGALLVRDQPMRVRWTLPSLISSDTHELTCYFTASVLAVAEAVERKMLAEVLLANRDRLCSDDLAAHFQSAFVRAGEQTAASATAGELLAPNSSAQNRLLESLRQAAKPIAFACGLDLLPPFSLEFQSASFQKQKLRSMQQTLIEQQRTDELQHLEKAADLLKKFQAIRRDAPELSTSGVLEQIAPADRGMMLRTLQLAGAKESLVDAPYLWAVAGSTLVKIDSANPSLAPELIPIPAELGPLRSVRSAHTPGEKLLLIGAQQGVHVLASDRIGKIASYSISGISSQQGFNSVIIGDDGKSLFASHGDAGLVTWNRENPAEPTTVIPAASFSLPSSTPMPSDTSISIAAGRGPRLLTRLDDHRRLFAAGSQLFVWSSDGVAMVPSADRGEIIAILPHLQGHVVIRDDGTISRINSDSTIEIQTLQQRPMRLRSACLMPWMDCQRILLASEDGAVSCVALEDTLVSEYVSPHRGLRIVAGSAALVAAVSPDRQRLILWNSWEGQRPACEIYVTAKTRHRIADIAF